MPQNTSPDFHRAAPATTFEALKKFEQFLGSKRDFVDHVSRLEADDRLDQLARFESTGETSKRYLATRLGGVIDFRHFFAAMMQVYRGSLTEGSPLLEGMTSEGDTLLLGVGNEVAQCISETLAWKINSCFSHEDLPSNRHGARFGESLVIARAEADFGPIAPKLSAFLEDLEPLDPKGTEAPPITGPGGTAVEALRAFGAWLGNALVSPAY